NGSGRGAEFDFANDANHIQLARNSNRQRRYADSDRRDLSEQQCRIVLRRIREYHGADSHLAVLCRGMGGRMKFDKQRGLSLIETMVAVLILLIGIVSVMSLFAVAMKQNTNQGDFATRTTEYCQDKMEQLLALSFSDSATDTTVYPPATSGGTGLGSGLAPSG